jgi:hypothetical protein
MRTQKTLINLLNKLVKLISDEYDNNEFFREKIEILLSDLPENKVKSKRSISSTKPENIPDIYEEWRSRDETDFRIWLRNQPISLLRTIIKVQDFDPIRRTVKWKDNEKLAEFIVDVLRSRISRGSSFIGRSTTD